jgi:polysaccharide biosynthesis protein PslG
VLIVGLLLSMVLVPASAGAAEMGLTTDLTRGVSRSQMDRELAWMKDLHARWIRADIPWNALEQDAKGVYTNPRFLSDIGYGVSRAHAAGIQVEMTITSVPYWASADPNKSQDASGYHYDASYRPNNFQDYADFAAWVANHFKGLGVHTYEIWNEPNLAYFWPSGPDAPTYVQMLKAAYPAIHGADPSATVLMGGLFTSDYDFLQAMYDAGAKPYFDGANIHPYSGPVGPNGCFHQHGTTRKPKTAFCGIQEIRNTMVANGDGAKKLWLTELGYSTEQSGDGMGVTFAQQAQYLTAAYKKVQGYAWVKAMFWYELRNSPSANPWGSNQGLRDSSDRPKPAYFAFKAYAIATRGGTRPPRARRRPRRRKHH